MKKKAIALILALTMLLAVCGCGAADTPAEPTNPGTSATEPGSSTGTDDGSAGARLLTNNHSVSGGPESALLNNAGVGFVPTARQTAPTGYVRVSKNRVHESSGFIDTIVYAYDEAGRQISIANQRSNGAIDAFETFSYNDQGQLFLHKKLSEKLMYMYVYDSEGRSQAIEHYDTKYDASGVAVGQTTYSYDGDRVIESYYPSGSSTPEYHTVYVGGKIQEYSYDGKYNQYWNLYEYDDQGNLKYMFTSENDGAEPLYEYLYDERGVLTEVIDCYGGSFNYLYNEAGDCILIESGSPDWETGQWTLDVYFEFTYDANGNLLTEKGFYADGSPWGAYYYTYTYESIA